jgi:hypothetical protein
MDSRIRDQVCLELVQVDIESTIKTERRGDGADHLGDEAVQVLVTWTRNIQISPANIIYGLIIDKERTIRVLDGAVGRKDSIVWLNDGS